MNLAAKMNQALDPIKPSSILAFNQEISHIEGIIPLTLGEPDFATPEHVKNAGIQAINNNESHYAPSTGLLELRTAAAEFLKDKYNAQYDPNSEVIVTVGATGGIYSSLTAILNPGDEVILPVPIFPLYIPIVIMNGAKPVFVDTSNDGFKLTPEKLNQTLIDHPQAKAIILNYPSNPTGVTLTRAELQALADVIKQHEIFVISDEIYSELSFDHPHVSLGEILPEQTILLNGVSKSHAMTGWRIGILATNQAIMKKIAMVNQFTVTAATTNAQKAALEAFQNGAADTLPMKAEYLKRRDLVVKELNAMGMATEVPTGAFYAFAKIPERFGNDSFAFARKLAREAKVAVIPGGSFPAGEGYVRLSYATSIEQLQEAIKRMKHYLEEN